MKLTILSLLLLLFTFGCSENQGNHEFKRWITPNGKVKVLSTIAMIHDLVQEVGSEHIDPYLLIKGELDPHSYQLVKGDDEKIAFADLIFYNGLGLEHGASLQRHLQSSSKAIALGDAIAKSHPELIIMADGQYDPHIWMDALLWSQTIPFIVAALSESDPLHSDIFQKNGKALQDKLEKLHERLKETLGAIPEEKRYLVTSHDAFNYFTKAYMATKQEIVDNNWQKRFAAPEGLAPECQLSTTDIKNILVHLIKYQITVIFPESNVCKDSLKKIQDAGKKDGLDLTIASESLYADAMGKPGSDGETYEKMLQYDANIIARYLYGR